MFRKRLRARRAGISSQNRVSGDVLATMFRPVELLSVQSIPLGTGHRGHSSRTSEKHGDD